jgi:hypothetical protein
MTSQPRKSAPGSWSHFLLSRAAVGAALGAGAAGLLVASPATGLLPLLAATDAGFAGPWLLAVGFSGLSSAAFLATALALGMGGDGRGTPRGRVVPVPVQVRQPPRRT